MPVGNKEYKDRLFHFLFGSEEKKDWTLTLYNAINDTHLTDKDAIKITTIQEVLYLGMHNDVSFLISDVMNLYEQQSSFNPNMPLRELLYVSSLYGKYIKEQDMNIYGSRLLHVPVPKLINLYFGSEEFPNDSIFRLSDSFPKDSDPDIDVRVRVININFKRRHKILSKCEPLKEYSWLVNEITENHNDEPLIKKINEALDNMPDDFVIKDHLVAHRTEVAGMLLTEYDEKEAMRLFRKEGLEEGLEKGREEGLFDTVISLVRKGLLSVADAAAEAGVSEAELQKRMNP